jgi:hypothetical protein
MGRKGFYMNSRTFWKFVKQHSWILWAILELWDEERLTLYKDSPTILGSSFAEEEIHKIRYLSFRPLEKLDLNLAPAHQKTEKITDMREQIIINVRFYVLYHIKSEFDANDLSDFNKGTHVYANETINAALDRIVAETRKENRAAEVVIDAVIKATSISKYFFSLSDNPVKILDDIIRTSESGRESDEERMWDIYSFHNP